MKKFYRYAFTLIFTSLISYGLVSMVALLDLYQGQAHQVALLLDALQHGTDGDVTEALQIVKEYQYQHKHYGHHYWYVLSILLGFGGIFLYEWRWNSRHVS